MVIKYYFINLWVIYIIIAILSYGQNAGKSLYTECPTH